MTKNSLYNNFLIINHLHRSVRNKIWVEMLIRTRLVPLGTKCDLFFFNIACLTARRQVISTLFLPIFNPYRDI